MEHTGHYYEVLAHQLSEANLFVSAINPKLIKDFDNDSLRKVKSTKLMLLRLPDMHLTSGIISNSIVLWMNYAISLKP